MKKYFKNNLGGSGVARQGFSAGNFAQGFKKIVENFGCFFQKYWERFFCGCCLNSAKLLLTTFWEIDGEF